MPNPPVNIKVIYSDGTEVPIEVAYRGFNDQGEHLWQQVSPEYVVRHREGSFLRRYTMDKLPARTAVRFNVMENEP